MMQSLKANITSLAGNKTFLFYLLTLSFITINAVLIAYEKYYFLAFPIVLFLAYVAIVRMDWLMIIIAFMTPLSITLWELGIDKGFDLFLPTEPLMICIVLFFLLRKTWDKKFDKKIFFHPVSVFIYFNLIWIFITSLTSTHVIVSIKYLISRLWFVIPFYFLGIEFFKNQKNISRFILAYLLGLLLVIAYTWVRHLKFGLGNEEAAHYVMNPFYKDHTSYGAILAMFIPVVMSLLFMKRFGFFIKIFFTVILIILFIALVLSYTRAAWISLVLALGVWILIKLRLRLTTFVFIGAMMITIFFSFRATILSHINQNNQASNANLAKHAQSITNITTDDSNMERINRWKSALRMFAEKPFFGWGPGTYMFEYAPFQFSYDKTLISTNAGDLGNAHSEYIGPLAESGILGMLTFLGIVIVTVVYGLRSYKKARDKDLSVLSLGVILGLITYFIHGILNNFLDTDKASVPFWGFIAVLVAIDVYFSKDNKKINIPTQKNLSKES